MSSCTSEWTRREWMTRHAALAVGLPFARQMSALRHVSSVPPDRAQRHAIAQSQAPLTSHDLTAWDVLAQHAVDAAKRAGAQYAEARLTRTVVHPIHFTEISEWTELIGVGVRALVNGYWGFTAAPGGDTAAVERIAREAVAQAKSHARGLPRTVEFGTITPATGTWTMPVKVDPLTIPFEEKLAVLQAWWDYAQQLNAPINALNSYLYFIRQERVVATSEGSHFTQTVYESGGQIHAGERGGSEEVLLDGFIPMGQGWELALDADVPGQLRTVPQRIDALRASQANPKPAQIGRYTLVCDGATMASLVEHTLAIATQLDRALGYEANASGSSFLNDPLTMLGQFQVGSPQVTLTANRTAPGQLATVKWDDEGVTPDDFTLVKDGVLVDYQTTREQAAWLAPYYQRAGRAVRSHGCATADSALGVPLQQTPNLSLAPNPTDAKLGDLVTNVKDGILVTDGLAKADFQARTGILQGYMHEITNGKIGRPLQGGAIKYDTLDLWKHVIAVGGRSSQAIIASTAYPYGAAMARLVGLYPVKGEPPQRSSNNIQAVAATITNQTVIDLMRKA